MLRLGLSCTVAAEASSRPQAIKHRAMCTLESLPAWISFDCRPRYADAVSIRCCTAMFRLLTMIVVTKIPKDCQSMRFAVSRN